MLPQTIPYSKMRRQRMRRKTLQYGEDPYEDDEESKHSHKQSLEGGVSNVHSSDDNVTLSDDSDYDV